MCLTLPLSCATSTDVIHLAWAAASQCRRPVLALNTRRWPEPNPATMASSHSDNDEQGQLQKIESLVNVACKARTYERTKLVMAIKDQGCIWKFTPIVTLFIRYMHTLGKWKILVHIQRPSTQYTWYMHVTCDQVNFQTYNFLETWLTNDTNCMYLDPDLQLWIVQPCLYLPWSRTAMNFPYI